MAAAARGATRVERWDVIPTTPGPRAFLEWTALAAVATVPVAALSYYLVERPALSLKRLVPAHGTVPRDEAVAEPAPAKPPVAHEG